jgi:hypothetical protein
MHLGRPMGGHAMGIQRKGIDEPALRGKVSRSEVLSMRASKSILQTALCECVESTLDLMLEV